jgi:hypothetical protein
VEGEILEIGKILEGEAGKIEEMEQAIEDIAKEKVFLEDRRYR